MTVLAHSAAAAPPARVVACLLASGTAAIPAFALASAATVRLFDDRRTLLACARAGVVVAAVVDLRDAAGRSTTGTVRALRGLAPTLPVFARCQPLAHDCRLLLDFARAGGTDVLFDGDYDALRASLALSTAPRPDRSLVARLVAAGVPSDLSPILDALFDHLDDTDAAGRVASALGVSRRALERRLSRAALPPPRVLQSWCRLLAAADRLAGDGAAVERVAHDVGFSSANALRNAMQRYGGATPTAMRGGGLDALVARFCGDRDVRQGRRVAEAAPCALPAALAARSALLRALTDGLLAPSRRVSRVAPRVRALNDACLT